MIKQEKDLNICKICGFVAKNSRGRNSHLTRVHKDWTVEKYYLTFYPKHCIVCSKKLKYKDKYLQYKFCSRKCLAVAFKEHVPKNKGVRKHAKKELLDELVSLHKKYNGYVTQSLMRTNGKYSVQLYHNVFGSWNNACREAKVPFIPKMTFNYNYKNYSTPLTITVDSREMKPYFFEDFVVEKLDVGDYALRDCPEQKVVIERKSISDLKGTFSNQINRFQRELDRAREQNLYVVIFADCSKAAFFKKKNYFGRMTNRSIYHNIKFVCSKYADCCQILFTGSKKKSNSIVFLVLATEKSYLKGVDLQEEYDNKRGIFE